MLQSIVKATSPKSNDKVISTVKGTNGDETAPFRYHSSHSLGPLVGWISLETPRLLPFLSYTRSSRCLWCRNAENICVGRGRLELLVSSPAKGAPFLSKLFLTRKREKVEVWSRFGIVFVHGNRTIPQIYLFCFQNKRHCCVFIPLSLVLMLWNSYQAFTHQQFETRLRTSDYHEIYTFAWSVKSSHMVFNSNKMTKK